MTVKLLDALARADRWLAARATQPPRDGDKLVVENATDWHTSDLRRLAERTLDALGVSRRRRLSIVYTRGRHGGFSGLASISDRWLRVRVPRPSACGGELPVLDFVRVLHHEIEHNVGMLHREMTPCRSRTAATYPWLDVAATRVRAVGIEAERLVAPTRPTGDAGPPRPEFSSRELDALLPRLVERWARRGVRFDDPGDAPLRAIAIYRRVLLSRVAAWRREVARLAAARSAPARAAAVEARRNKRLEAAREKLVEWTSRWRLAATKVAAWRRRLRALERADERRLAAGTSSPRLDEGRIGS